jgi:hypothetical protein
VQLITVIKILTVILSLVKELVTKNKADKITSSCHAVDKQGFLAQLVLQKNLSQIISEKNNL